VGFLKIILIFKVDIPTVLLLINKETQEFGPEIVTSYGAESRGHRKLLKT